MNFLCWYNCIPHVLLDYAINNRIRHLMHHNPLRYLLWLECFEGFTHRVLRENIFMNLVIGVYLTIIFFTLRSRKISFNAFRCCTHMTLCIAKNLINLLPINIRRFKRLIKQIVVRIKRSRTWGFFMSA